MRYLFVIIIVLYSLNLHGQNFPENFKVDDFLEFYSNDSLLYYFNSTGMVVDRSKATFFRIGRIDSVNINVCGRFKDFYENGKIALEAKMKDNCLDSIATYYYDNGYVQSKGNYIQDNKDGIWEYYYRNGQIEKVINYQNGNPIIVEYYKKNGKQMVFEGNGKYKGYFNNYESDYNYKIKGELSDGKMHGKWTWYGSSKVGDEYFDHGVFVKGISRGYEYNDVQKINLVGYFPDEIINFYDNNFGHPIVNGRLIAHTVSVGFPAEYLAIVSDSLNNSVIKNQKEQWIFVKIKLKKNNTGNDIIIKSSLNDTIIEERVFTILKSIESIYNIVYTPSIDSKLEYEKGWYTSKDTNIDYFFTMLLINHSFIIPAAYL